MSDTDYRIAKLDVRAGDILVVKLNGRCSMETHERLKAHFTSEMPGVRFLIVDKDIDLAVLSAEEIAQRSAA